MTALTVEQFKEALPERFKKSVNQDLVDGINQALSEPELYEAYRDNLLSYTKVLLEGRNTITDYVNAVKYVSHKLMGCTNIEAYSKTFPDRMQRFAAQGTSSKDISSYVAIYNKSKMVNTILEQTLIPSFVLNQDIYQKAINTQAELMVSARSEKVRCDAANSLLTHLRPPEVKKVELDIGVKEDSSIQSLRDATLKLAKQQRLMVEAGMMDAQEIAHQPLTIDMGQVEVVNE